MVEQVRRHGKDPFAYFEWVFEKLMHLAGCKEALTERELEALLPKTWLAEQARPSAAHESQAA